LRHDPSPPPPATLVEDGQQALERGAWREARSAFERALGTGDEAAKKHSFRAIPESERSAEILSGLAEALDASVPGMNDKD
jgi:hypothetical protein